MNLNESSLYSTLGFYIFGVFWFLFLFVTLDKGSVFICVLVPAPLSCPPPLMLTSGYSSLGSEMDGGWGNTFPGGTKRNLRGKGSGFPDLS